MGGASDEPERMSDLEAMMWALEPDPFLSSTFANLTMFDRAPDHERLRRRLWRASQLVPRLRRRVVAGFGPVTPAWQEDPDFDIDHHLRWVTLPRGATDADARTLATDLALAPLDTDRPLWEFTVIDGLPDGRAAMVQKMHHTITDGKGGIRMSVEFIDLERDTPEPPPVDDGPPPEPPAGPAPALAAFLLRNAEDALHRFQARAGSVGGAVTDTVRHPTQLATLLADLPGETTATVASLIRQFGVVTPHRSPLWTDRSLERELHVFEVPLDQVKAAAGAMGGSVNDLFVAAAAGGAGAYHRARGHDTDELRMNMPVSTRTDRSGGGNAFAPTRVLVPLDPDPAVRFDEIHRRLGVTKTERALGLAATMSGVAKLLPRPVLVRIARQQVMTVDFTTSNVRGAPFPVYIAGALVERNYPLGPVMGTAWNLTTMSYRGLLNIGLHVDSAAVEDPGALAQNVQDAFDELLNLVP